jgi:hypothetical protein
MGTLLNIKKNTSTVKKYEITKMKWDRHKRTCGIEQKQNPRNQNTSQQQQ